jgi:hypothetical protein
MKISLIFSSLLLSACVGLPSTEQIAAADYGQYPQDYEVIVKKYYSLILKDPDSVKYQNFSTPKKSWVGSKFSGARYGYLVCTTLNAKNSYGAYVGYKQDALLIKNGDVIEYIPRGDWFGHAMCKIIKTY